MATFRLRNDRWYIRYTDGQDRRREVRAGKDRRAAEQLAMELETRATRERLGLIDPAESRIMEAAKIPIAEHVADWMRDMEARDLVARHITLCGKRVHAMLKLMRATRLADISPSGIQAVLASLREEGYAPYTVHHYFANLRAFCRFLVRDGRLRIAPTSHVLPPKLIEVRDRALPRRVFIRRALSQSETEALIREAESGPRCEGVEGPDRAMLYRIALATGFRASELNSLTPENFRNLDGDTPLVALPAPVTKNRKPVRQPIARSLAADLKRWLEDRTSEERLWPMWRYRYAAAMVRRDLRAAEIEITTEEGRIDFHSLRHTYVTRLVATGCDLKTAQTLARHSTPVLTMNNYAHIESDNLRAAVEAVGSPKSGAPEPGKESPKPQAEDAPPSRGAVSGPAPGGPLPWLAGICHGFADADNTRAATERPG